MKILVAEDDREYRSILYGYLHSLGHDVLVVSDAVHAVALLSDEDHGISLVILDLMMPRLGGDDLMRSFAYWRTSKARYIIVSGSLDFDRFEGHPKVAATFQKPFSLADLGKAVAAELNRLDKEKDPAAVVAAVTTGVIASPSPRS